MRAEEGVGIALWSRHIKVGLAPPHGANSDARETGLRHRVSPRYIQKLFETERISFTDFVRAGRLAHRILRDPRLSHMSISTIDCECGFGDIAAFNRASRRHYSASPSNVRHSDSRY